MKAPLRGVARARSPQLVRDVLLCLSLTVIAFLPLYTEKPYIPADTPQVIFAILSQATQPYAAWGWVFHVATVSVVALAVLRPVLGGRAVAAYFGLNYLVIAAVQTHAQTEQYGFAVHTGALVAGVLLGAMWLVLAWRDPPRLPLSTALDWRWALLPLALLAFWSPMTMEGASVRPDFNPLLLLTSPEYGLAYCFVTPVFLFLLMLAHPNVNQVALRITAFNGLLYGLFNLSHWGAPERVWLGVLHLPLLVIAIAALGLTYVGRPVRCMSRA